MANCIIYQKDTDEVVHFIKNCTQNGRDFIGDNLKLIGVKLTLFDVKWTEEDILDQKSNNIKKVSEFSDALRYEGIVVSNRDDVNRVIRQQISSKYSIEDELKILRKGNSSSEFKEYNEYIEELLNKGNSFKDQYFPKEK